MEIILTQGLPASGKTTWANLYSKENNYFHISKDFIRKELVRLDGEENIDFEKRVKNREREIVREHMQKGHNIIVDNTHLLFKKSQTNPHIEYYSEEAKKYGYKFRVLPFYVDLFEAMVRDSKRENPVGVGVYERFKKIYEIPQPYPKNPVYKWQAGLPVAIIVDIDGTMAFMDGKRSPYDYSKVGGDRVNTHLNTLVTSIVTGYTTINKKIKVFIVSGRNSDCRTETTSWLQENGVTYDYLYMRDSADKRDDSIVKKEIYDEHIKNRYNVIAVFDDRDRVVKMWREQNLPTYQVWYGDF